MNGHINLADQETGLAIQLLSHSSYDRKKWTQHLLRILTLSVSNRGNGEQGNNAVYFAHLAAEDVEGLESIQQTLNLMLNSGNYLQAI